MNISGYNTNIQNLIKFLYMYSELPKTEIQRISFLVIKNNKIPINNLVKEGKISLYKGNFKTFMKDTENYAVQQN